jgi:MYXO-CTERM domain-containing protein
MEISSEKAVVQNTQLIARPQHVLFAESPPGLTFGVVSDSEPSSLALLAAGVAGLAARRARRSERIKSVPTQKAEAQGNADQGPG